MGKKLFGGFLLGGAVAFVWMLFSWMVMPWHCAVIGEFSDEAAVSQVIVDNIGNSGVYVLPHLCDSKADYDANMDEMEAGPVIFAAVQREGYAYNSLYPFVTSLLIQWIGAFFIVLLLLRAGLESYWSRVWFYTLFGLTIGILGVLPYWNWWGFSWGYSALAILNYSISGWLSGVVVAAVTSPE